jgi:hypothetical protein
MASATITARTHQKGRATPPPRSREAVTPSWVGRVPQLKQGRYADGYINLGATKTATVYRLLGNPPKALE